MGLINERQPYRCGISWLGVTGIYLRRNDSWGGYPAASDHVRQHGTQVLIGAVRKTTAQAERV